MEYSVQYYTKKEIYSIYGLQIKKYGELIIVENEAKFVLTYLQYMQSDRNLIRSYIVNANLFKMNSTEIFSRYNVKIINLKELLIRKRSRNVLI